MKVGPKYKICRRLGDPVFDKCSTTKFALSDSKKRASKTKGKDKRRKTRSEYGLKLVEKQKVKLTYGLTERQLSNYIKLARSQFSNESKLDSLLYKIVEARLDNIVYRLGLAPSRRAARQMVSHRHFLVNDKHINIPSHRVKVGDKISIREGSKNRALFTDLVSRLNSYKAPNWLSFDAKNLEGKILKDPDVENRDTNLDLNAVFEFYSRV